MIVITINDRITTIIIIREIMINCIDAEGLAITGFVTVQDFLQWLIIIKIIK